MKICHFCSRDNNGAIHSGTMELTKSAQNGEIMETNSFPGNEFSEIHVRLGHKAEPSKSPSSKNNRLPPRD